MDWDSAVSSDSDIHSNDDDSDSEFDVETIYGSVHRISTYHASRMGHKGMGFPRGASKNYRDAYYMVDTTSEVQLIKTHLREATETGSITLNEATEELIDAWNAHVETREEHCDRQCTLENFWDTSGYAFSLMEVRAELFQCWNQTLLVLLGKDDVTTKTSTTSSGSSVGINISKEAHDYCKSLLQIDEKGLWAEEAKKDTQIAAVIQLINEESVQTGNSLHAFCMYIQSLSDYGAKHDAVCKYALCSTEETHNSILDRVRKHLEKSNPMWMTKNELEREAISHYVSMVLKYAPDVENEETMLHVSENKELPKKNKPWSPDYSGFTSFGRSTTAKKKNATTTASSSSSTSTTSSGNVTSLQTIAADNLRKQAAETIAEQLKRWPTSCWLVRTMCMELAPYAQMTIFNMAWRILQANIGSMPRIISDMWMVGAAVDPKEVQEWEMLTSDLIASLKNWTERYDTFESCDEHGAWKQLKEEAKEIAERHLPPHGRLMLEEYEYESEYYVQPAEPGEYCRRSNSFVPTPSSNFGQDFLLPSTTHTGEYQTWGSIGISHLNWFKVLDATIVHGATISGSDERFTQPDTDDKVEEKKNWKKLTVAKLKVELQARMLSIAGKKADLVERLESNDAATSSTQKRTASGSMGGVRPQKQRKREDGAKKSSESTFFIVSTLYLYCD